MTQMHEAGAGGQGEPNTFALKIAQLTQELEILARLFNPDYAAEVDDGSHARIASTDFGGSVKTELIFEANRLRTWTPGKQFEEMVPGEDKDARKEYVLRGVVTYALGGFIAFPGPVRKTVTDSNTFVEELASSKTNYAVMFEQEFTVSTEGNLGRKLQLLYLINDCPIIPDVGSDDDLDADPLMPSASLGELANIFSASELNDLFQRSEAVVQTERSVGLCEKLHDNVAAISGASRMRQLGMIAALLTQFDGTADLAATA